MIFQNDMSEKKTNISKKWGKRKADVLKGFCKGYPTKTEIKMHWSSVQCCHGMRYRRWQNSDVCHFENQSFFIDLVKFMNSWKSNVDSDSWRETPFWLMINLNCKLQKRWIFWLVNKTVDPSFWQQGTCVILETKKRFDLKLSRFIMWYGVSKGEIGWCYWRKFFFFYLFCYGISLLKSNRNFSSAYIVWCPLSLSLPLWFIPVELSWRTCLCDPTTVPMKKSQVFDLFMSIVSPPRLNVLIYVVIHWSKHFCNGSYAFGTIF